MAEVEITIKFKTNPEDAEAIAAVMTNPQGVDAFIKIGKALVDHMNETQRKNMVAMYPWMKPFLG